MSDTTVGSRHVSTRIAAPPDAVYALAADPARLSEWAAGLARTPLHRDGDGDGDGDDWVADAPFGRITVRFTPTNRFGVLDHVVTMPSGEQVLNPMRVVAWGDGSEVVFTVRRREGMSDDDLAADARAVAADLETLRGLVENGD